MLLSGNECILILVQILLCSYYEHLNTISIITNRCWQILICEVYVLILFFHWIISHFINIDNIYFCDHLCFGLAYLSFCLFVYVVLFCCMNYLFIVKFQDFPVVRLFILSIQINIENILLYSIWKFHFCKQSFFKNFHGDYFRRIL